MSGYCRGAAKKAPARLPSKKVEHYHKRTQNYTERERVHQWRRAIKAEGGADARETAAGALCSLAEHCTEIASAGGVGDCSRSPRSPRASIETGSQGCACVGCDACLRLSEAVRRS